MGSSIRISILVFILSLSCLYLGVCQVNNLEIKGRILDEASKKPLIGASVMDVHTGRGIITDSKGDFVFQFTSFPLTLNIQYLGYFNDTVQIDNREQYQIYSKISPHLILLRINPFLIDKVEVTAQDMAIKLFKDEPYAIMDYVIKDNLFIAMGYKNHNVFKKELFLGKLSGDIIYSYPIKTLQEVYQDCLGENYAITKDSTYHLKILSDSTILHKAYDTEYFLNFVKPIQAINDSCYIYLNESENGFYKDYCFYDFNKNETLMVYRAGDIRDEFGYTSIDKQIDIQIAGKLRRSFIPLKEMREINDNISIQMFRRYDNFKPAKSSMIQNKDSALLFDFDDRIIICFALNADLQWYSEILVDLTKGFTGRVHHDSITQRFFLEFINAQLSYLIEIDPFTGLGLKTIPIRKYKHIDHVTIYDNKVFFLHQPDFGEKGKKLFYINL